MVILLLSINIFPSILVPYISIAPISDRPKCAEHSNHPVTVPTPNHTLFSIAYCVHEEPSVGEDSLFPTSFIGVSLKVLFSQIIVARVARKKVLSSSDFV